MARNKSVWVHIKDSINNIAFQSKPIGKPKSLEALQALLVPAAELDAKASISPATHGEHVLQKHGRPDMILQRSISRNP